MKLGFFEAEGWEKKFLDKELFDLDIYFTSEWLTKENVKNFQDLNILSIFICSQVDREIIDSLPNLKFIATRSTGFDHIDINYAKEKGILVANVPEYGTKTVAEWTMALMLNLTRKVYHAIDQIKEIESFDLNNLRGEELFGKTLGVIGTGKIGKEVIKLAKAFGMNVIAYDLYQDENFAKEYNINYLNLEEVLKNSDIISIHTNLNSSTYHLINRNNIDLIKPGAYLVNTARGGIVETSALIYALEKGILKGVALDVIEEELEIKDELELLVKYSQNIQSDNSDNFDKLKTIWANHVLMKMPNVLVTPHNAFNSKEAIERILKTTIDNIRGFLNGKVINVIAG